MSSLAFQIDELAYSGGRYFRAFDHLSIDHYEHSIMTYLGSLIRVESSCLELDVSPSVAEISRATKMSVSTVRRKIKLLESKGYLLIRDAHYTNAAGKIQQGSNKYTLAKLIFELYADNLTPCSSLGLHRSETQQPSPSSQPNYSEVQEPPFKPDDAEAGDQLPPIITDLDRVISFWTDKTGFPVGQIEMETFREGFERLGQGVEFYYSRIEKVVSDPKLKRIAQNINFLLLPAEIANGEELRRESPVSASENRTGFVDGSGKVNALVDKREILAAIDQRLALDIPQNIRARLAILREAVPKCPHEVSLKLYRKHVQSIPI